MKKLIGLALLADPRTGGWPTYTAHLAHGLSAIGWEPIIFRLGKRSETKPRDFGRGLQYWNISLPELKELSKNAPVLITAVGKNHRTEACELLALGASIVIHDPTELDSEITEAISSAQVVTIRRTISDSLAKVGVANTFVPHPYQRALPVEAEKRNHAVTLSRIDFDKNTHLVVEANRSLPEDKAIKIYGAINTLYAKVKLEEIDPDWERNYVGDWPAKASTSVPLKIARSADMVIDLSTIKGDGGGTQYSFLEIFDANKPLIIHERWLTGNPDYDEIAEAVAATVDSPESLIEVVSSEISFDEEASHNILQKHDARLVATEMVEVITG